MKKLLPFMLFVTITVAAFSQTTYTVNTTDDLPDYFLDDNVCADVNGNCTLRAAIQNANKTSAKDIIAFDISGTAPFTIVITTDELPAVTYPVIIDGRTQTEYAITNTPVIEIDGSTLPIDNSGLRLYGLSNNSEIYGLSIGGFQRSAVAPYYTGGHGIDVYSQSNIFQGNYLGLKPDGNTLNRNQWGVFFLDSGNNTVGGTGANQGNVVSGNYSGGVTFQGIGCSNNTVQGNLLGTDATGLLPRGNNFNLQFLNAPNNIVGGTAPGARNIISAGVNSRFGVDEDEVEDGTGMSITGVNSTNITIIGNYIGTDITGTAALPNTRGGILLLFGANNITIGGEGAGEGNVISGNGFKSSGDPFFGGIYFQGNETSPVVSNTIIGNYIGTDVTGNVAMPNSTGIYINPGSNNNTIGGTTPNSRNIISGNTYEGVGARHGDNNQIIGNYIGLNASGNASLPNATGIWLYQDAINTSIGGANPLDRNIISGNSLRAIIVSGSSHNIQNNYIGLNPAGDGVIKNNNEGIALFGALADTQISENVISGNGISSGRNVLIQGASGARLFSNKIGTLPDGITGVANSGGGIVLFNSSNIIIGGDSEVKGNVIAGHNAKGIHLLATCNDNIINNNKIGVGADGTTNIGNGSSGIEISGDIVGGTIANNIIANNPRGVYLNPSSGIATQIRISQNSIYNNAILGIDLGGATTNDVDDADTGVNNLQNTPEISAINYLGGSSLEITYLVPSSVTNSAYPMVIEFFGAVNGQGKFFIESDTYAAPGSKTVTINLPDGFDADDYINIVATATDDNGNTSEFGISTDTTLSIAQLENHSFKVYPNPVSDRLFIQSTSSGSYNLEVMNVLGQLVLAKKDHASSTSLDVSNLKNGIYFLNINYSNESSQTIKFIKN